MKGELKSFEELMESTDPIRNATGKEAEMRAEVFLNGYRMVEEDIRKQINNISFQLNRKFVKGCGVREIMESYNEMIGRLQDDFIF